MPSTTARLVSWSDVPLEQLNPLLQRRYVYGEQAMIAQVFLKQGCIVPTHAHHNEQLAIVMYGKMRFIFDPDGAADEYILGPGQVLIIPSNLPHSAEALEDTLDMDIFAPPRHDWIAGADAYLRQPV